MDDWDKLDEYFGYLYTTGDSDAEPTGTSGCSGCLTGVWFVLLFLWLVSKLFG